VSLIIEPLITTQSTVDGITLSDRLGLLKLDQVSYWSGLHLVGPGLVKWSPVTSQMNDSFDLC